MVGTVETNVEVGIPSRSGWGLLRTIAEVLLDVPAELSQSLLGQGGDYYGPAGLPERRSGGKVAIPSRSGWGLLRDARLARKLHARHARGRNPF